MSEPKQLSGKQVSAFRIQAFIDWMEKMPDQDYRLIIHGGQIKREDIVTQCQELVPTGVNFDRQCLTKNGNIETLLFELETRLWEAKILLIKPVLGKDDRQKKKIKPKQKGTLPKGAITAGEAAKLHLRILELESENEALKSNYGRFSEVAEVYQRLGQMKS